MSLPNLLIGRLEKSDLVKKGIFWYGAWSKTSKLMQKRVTYICKSPYNFIFEPEFFTDSINGEPGGTRTHDTKLKRLVL